MFEKDFQVDGEFLRVQLWYVIKHLSSLFNVAFFFIGIQLVRSVMIPLLLHITEVEL